jgi:hypothetical protein
MLDGFVTTHADAVVGNRDGACLRVGIDRDGELAAPCQQVGLRQRRETQLVQRVRALWLYSEWIISLSSCLTSA